MTVRRLDDLARSERYFTATLLPALLLGDPAEDVRAFVDWLHHDLGLRAHAADDVAQERPLCLAASPAWVEVVTELNLKRDLRHYGADQLEAAAADPAVQDARAQGTDRQSVPDVVIRADDLLVVIEGKFFVSGVTPHTLGLQLVEQREEVALMVAHLGGDVKRVAHLYLGPQELGPLPCDGTFTWAQVAAWAASRVGADHYVTQRLHAAVARFGRAASPKAGGVSAVNYARRVRWATMVALCRERGDDVVVGFFGGLDALRAAAPEALRTRLFKVDEARGGVGTKVASNWLPGTAVLEVLGARGMTD